MGNLQGLGQEQRDLRYFGLGFWCVGLWDGVEVGCAVLFLYLLLFLSLYLPLTHIIQTIARKFHHILAIMLQNPQNIPPCLILLIFPLNPILNILINLSNSFPLQYPSIHPFQCIINSFNINFLINL